MTKGSLTHLVGGAAAAALVLSLAAAGHAAPQGSIASALAGKAQGVEKIADRRDGRVGTRNAKGPRVYGYSSFGPKRAPGSGGSFSYGMPSPDELPVGSNAWWGAMKSTGHID